MTQSPIEEIYDDFSTGSVLAFAGITLILLMITATSQQALAAANRFPVLSAPPEATAANMGLAWVEPRAGSPAKLRLIAENSTGAFEIVLLGVTT